MMRVVRRESKEKTRNIQKMVTNSITKVWQKGVDDEGGKAEARNYKKDREDGEELDK
jgi:hypothetical protein